MSDDFEGIGGQDWMELASCKGQDPEQFFPRSATQSAAARRICSTCPVQVDCMQYAIENDIDFGIWGGEAHTARETVAQAAWLGTYRPRVI